MKRKTKEESLTQGRAKRLRSNSRIVCQRVMGHVLRIFDDWEQYEGAKCPLDALRQQVESMVKNRNSSWGYTRRDACKDIILGGMGLVYWGDVRRQVQAWLEQSDEEAGRYDDEETWNLYVELCAREAEAMLDGRRTYNPEDDDQKGE